MSRKIRIYKLCRDKTRQKRANKLRRVGQKNAHEKSGRLPFFVGGLSWCINQHSCLPHGTPQEHYK